MFCENCGAELTGGGRFCPECGTAVTIRVQNQYKRELEMGGQAFAYLPEEEPVKKTEPNTGSGYAEAEDTYSYTGTGSRKSGDSLAQQALDYMSDEKSFGSSYDRKVPDYGYSDDTIRAAQDELDRPSSAEEYKKTSTDWRDHVDSERFRQQNAQPVENDGQGYTNQPYYTQPDRFAYDRRQPADHFHTYGTQFSNRNYIVAALLAFFLGGFGAHNFYLGYTKKGTIQLVLSLMSFLTVGTTGLVAGIWGFVEFILLLTGTINTDGDGRPMKR